MQFKILDWNKLSPARKKSLSKKPTLTFIAGPREISKVRAKQLIEKYGTEENYLLFGVLKDNYIPELEFPQFRSMKGDVVLRAVEKLGEIGMGKLRILNHRHEDTAYIISELKPKKVIFINGSYKRAIHLRQEYWKALDAGAEVIMESVFINDSEAKRYFQKIEKRKSKKEFDKYKVYTDKEILKLAEETSANSFDWIYPIGAVLGENGKPKILAHNAVLPYETYSALKGSIREKNKSPAGDQNHYDTNHAEMEILERAREKRIGLRGKTLYINVFPCSTCCRILSRTELSRVVYSLEHSSNYGIKLLKESGVKVEKIV
ncbi:MAG TPA: hypothetical protein ENI23_02545 [bacterium]|nr:hypothetical protein [bacterium]